MKIAIGQINPVIGDFEYNAGRIRSCAQQAVSDGCQLVVFSELVVSGYPPRDLLEKSDFIEANQRCLAHLVDSISGIGCILGTIRPNPAEEGKALLNSAVLFEDGQILHETGKQLLPTYDVFDETRYFEPGGRSAPVIFKGRHLGLTICEDVWNDKDAFPRRIYHDDPVAHLVQNGADLLLNISASPFYTGKNDFRRRLLGAISKKHRLPLIYVNQVGGNDSVLFDGLSCAFDAAGEMVAQACGFQEDLVVLSLDENGLRGIRDRPPTAASTAASMLAALTMGTRDYVQKCGFSDVVIGLSGGIDSALTAYIAVQALGPDHVSVVFMPSRYTSRDNFEDTRRLADSLGVKLTTVPIDGIFNEFTTRLASQYDQRDPGIMEQNLQARIRGTLLMAVSNRDGSLLLSTGNKSELAVGYCTLYGDMNGGLAVISDVPKTMVYELARYANRDREAIPRRMIEKAPSAELKPDQKDQDDLPPYEILDTILSAYVEESRGVQELVGMGFDRDLVVDVIRRIDTNEYKRYQAAPGLKVTSKAFGYGRRYPLAKRYRPG